MARDVADGADMVLHVGDISYANGDGAVWDSFMAAIEPASKHVPYMVAVGTALPFPSCWKLSARSTSISAQTLVLRPELLALETVSAAVLRSCQVKLC